jgi:hypothetical protein
VVWRLRYCRGTASWKEASRDEGRGSRATRQISSRHQPLASGRWTLDSCRLSPRLHLLCLSPRPSALVPRLRLSINGSVLGLTIKEPERRPPAGRVLRLGEAARRKGAAGRPAGLRGSGEPRTKSTPKSTRSLTLPRFGNSSIPPCRVIPRGAPSARKFKVRR